jgi:hypothetical protein
MEDDDITHNMNGDFYVVGQQGEVEEALDHRLVYVPDTDVGLFPFANAVTGAPADRLAALKRIQRGNFWKLLGITGEHAVTVLQAKRIAFLRAQAICRSLGDTGDNPADHNVKYNDLTIVAGVLACTRGLNAAGVVEDVAEFDGFNRDIPDWNVDEPWRRSARKKMTNMICVIAFFMRTRGHHWTPDTNDRYAVVWRRCLYQEDNPDLEWRFIAHHAFHFLYPDVIDAFWKNAIDKAFCAGTLAKRYDSFAAGTAIIGACSAGADDVCVLFPTLRGIIQGSFVELDRCRRALQGHRWAGCINRRFYGGEELVADEKALGPLAATILGALESLASTSHLRESRALARVAQNAPITGALVANLIRAASQDKRMINFLFLAPNVEEEEEE